MEDALVWQNISVQRSRSGHVFLLNFCNVVHHGRNDFLREILGKEGILQRL